MAFRSIVDVEINDQSFAEYARKFEKYQKLVKDLPGDWAKVAAGTLTTKGAFDQLVNKHTAARAQAELTAAAMKKVELSTRTSGDIFRKMAGDTKNVAANIGAATVSLLKWAGLTTVFSSLLGAGGLYGIDRMAAGVTAERRSAAGLGISMGQQSAFNLNFSRFADTASMLSNIATALSDPTSKQYTGLLSSGANANYLKTHNAADVGEDLLHRLPQIFKGVSKEMIGTIAQARGITDILSVEDIKRYLAASPQERAQQESAYGRDTKAFEIDPAVAKGWNDLTSQLARAGTEIEKTFVTGLAPLAGPIGDLSKGVTDLVVAFLKTPLIKDGIEEVSGGLETFAKYIGTDNFKQDAKEFAALVGKMAHAIKTAYDYIKDWFGEDDKKAAHTPDATGNDMLMRAGTRGGAFDDSAGNAARVRGKVQAFGGRGDGSSLGARTAVDKSIPAEGRAFLDDIASGEAKDYNIKNGGGTFSDYSHHPGDVASGRYQDLPSTWKRIQSQTGLPDFSPESQDKGNWWLAQQDYKQKSGGRDLLTDLQSKDPTRIASIGNILHSTWVSTNGSFAGKYQDALGRINSEGAAGKGPDWMNDKSKRELSGLNKDLANDLLTASKESGIKFQISQGLRTQEQADRNAADGSGVRDSQHLYGAAADLKMLDAQGNPTMDRSLYKKFADAYTAASKAHGGSGRWLGDSAGRWGSDYVHFDQGIGYGQSHTRDPFGTGGPTADDIKQGNEDAYKGPQNPFLTKGTQATLDEAQKQIDQSNLLLKRHLGTEKLKAPDPAPSLANGRASHDQRASLGVDRFQMPRAHDISIANNTGANVNVTAAAGSYG